VAKSTKRRTRRKEKKNINYAVAHIHSTFNNTIISITDKQGAVIGWASGGTVGLREPVNPLPTPHRWQLK